MGLKSFCSKSVLKNHYEVDFHGIKQKTSEKFSAFDR
jgi:hypothetical protein